MSKPELLREAEAHSQLDRIAPNWRLHLYDGAIIDHILEVINKPRASRTEIGRRYRARRSAAGLVGTPVFRGAPSRCSPTTLAPPDGRYVHLLVPALAGSPQPVLVRPASRATFIVNVAWAIPTLQMSTPISTFFDTPTARLSHDQCIQQFAGPLTNRPLASVLRYYEQHVQDFHPRYPVTEDAGRRRERWSGPGWLSFAPLGKMHARSERGRKLVVDLRNLTTISHEGEDAIFDLMKEGARFSCGNVLTNHVLKQLAQKKQRELPRS